MQMQYDSLFFFFLIVIKNIAYNFIFIFIQLFYDYIVNKKYLLILLKLNHIL